MKKIPIKFRGCSLETGEVIFSRIVDYGSDFAKIGYWVRAYGAWELRWENVDPDSVAQLVGYDVDGKEVYEGDTLTDILGNEYTARIRIELICEDRRSTLRGKVYAGTVDNLKLKGEAA